MMNVTTAATTSLFASMLAVLPVRGRDASAHQAVRTAAAATVSAPANASAALWRDALTAVVLFSIAATLALLMPATPAAGDLLTFKFALAGGALFLIQFALRLQHAPKAGTAGGA